MSSNLRILSVSADRRKSTANGITTFDDDPTDTDGASNPSLILAADIVGALHGSNGANGTSVVVSTQSAVETEEGDLRLSAALTYTNTVARSLTLNAARDILLESDITPFVAAGPLNLAFNAGSSAINPTGGVPDIANPAGNVVMSAGITIDSNGGTIGFTSAAGQRQSMQGTIRSGGGAVGVAQGIDLAGDLSITAGAGGITIGGGVDGAHALVLDATGAAVSFGTVGSTARLTGLGVAATAATLSGAFNIDELAVNLTGANQRVNLTNPGALLIGTVGSISGITTNTGNVLLMANGLLEIAAAISTAGTAAQNDIGQGLQTGAVTLIGSGGIELGADIRTDGGAVVLQSPVIVTAGTVTIDTDQTAGGNAGNVTFGGSASLNGMVGGENALLVDAGETGSGAGLAGAVSFAANIGTTTRLGALGVHGGSVAFNNGNGGNDVDTLALALSGANQGLTFTDRAGLTIGGVGSLNGITTNTGNVSIFVSTGDLVVAKAIDTAGTAPASGGSIGFVTLNVQGGSLTVSDTISGASTGTAVSLGASGITTVDAAITARTGNIAISGAGGIVLGADLQTDSGAVTVSNASRIAKQVLTIDTDRSAGGNAGNVTLSTGGGINGAVDGANTLIIDARETGAGSGLGGSVLLGVIGATTRLGALGVGGAVVGFNNGGNANRLDLLAVDITTANRSVSLATATSLTVGEVGPYSGIRTNSGTVFLNVGGNLTIDKAIHTVGPAPAGNNGQGDQAGLVQLIATGNLTINDTITGAATTVGNVGIVLSGAGITAVKATLTATTGGVQFTNTGGTTRLGADIQTDGGNVSLGGNPTFLTVDTVTIDTDRTEDGNAGNVSIGPVNGDSPGARTLLIDARETGSGSGLGGGVTINGPIGGTNRLGSLGIGAGALGVSNAVPHMLDTLAVELSTANRGFGFTFGASLTVGDVGPYSGITTNSGNFGITVTTGNLTVAQAINTIGTAPAGENGQGFQSGVVTLAANAGNLTISDTITARGLGSSSPITAINLSSSGITSINADVTAIAGSIVLQGSGVAVLRANLQTDGSGITLNNAVTLAANVTLDTDRTAGGNAGGLSVSSLGLRGDTAGTRTLIIDARESGTDASGSVGFFGGIGGGGRLAGLGIGAGSVSFNNVAGGANDIAVLAVALSNFNAGIGLLTFGALTIGEVGPFKGIRTNGGVVSINVESGNLTVAEAIDTSGLVSPSGGMVTLTTHNSNTLTVSSAITAVGMNLTANGTGTIAINADLDARTGTLTLNAPNGGALRLGAALQTDGAAILLTGSVMLTSTTVTLDTDRSVGTNAGNVVITGMIDGNLTNANTLVVDAHETGDGIGGLVNLNGAIGGTTRLAGLGVLARSVSFASADNNVGVLAVEVMGPNQAFGYTDADALTIGTVGPVSGITTNTGNVTVTVTFGALAVEQQIDTDGATAPVGVQTGAVTLNASNGVTLSGPAGDVTAAGAFTVNADSDQNLSGGYVQGAGATVSAASVQITAADVTINDAITSLGNVTLLPSAVNATIGVAGLGNFTLTDAELDRIATPGALTIGSVQNAGGISIATTGALSQDKNLSFVTGGNISFGSSNLQTSGAVTLTAGRVIGGSGVVVAPSLSATTATGLTLNTSVDMLTLTNTASGSVVATNAGAVSVSGTNNAGAFDITAGGTLTVGGVIVAQSARLSGTSLALDNAVNATFALELVSAGGITQTAALSAATLVGSSTGAANLANPANAIGALGPFSANGLTIMDAAGGLTIGGAVNAGTGAAAITTTGDLAVVAGIDGAGVTLTANGGAIRLGAAVNAHAGAALLQGPVVLTANATVSGAVVAFGGSVNGGFALAVSGPATFSGAVGTTAALASLNVGAVTLDGGAVVTTGVQNYSGAVTLGANTTFTGTAATFAAAIGGGGFDLALHLSGTTALNAASFTAVRNLSTGNGGTTELSGTISTTGTQSYEDAVRLVGATTVTSAGAGASGNVAFGLVDATTAGGQSLTVDSAGTATFGAAVGGTALASLATDAAGTTAINGGSVTTTGAQSYGDAVTLGADATLTSTALGNIAFGGTVNGAHALNVVSGGTTTFGGAIGDLVALSSLTTDANGATIINGGLVNTTAAQTYGDAVTFGGATALSSAGGAIAFNGAVQAGGLLTVSTAGSATFHGVVSGAGGLLQNGSGTTTLLADNLYTGATTVNAGTLLVEGSVASASLVTVNSGATLGGSGTVGAVTVADGGFLTPGTSPGALHTGNLLLSPGATLTIEIGAATFDQLDVTGTVTIAGARLATELLASFVPGNGSSFVIIDNDGSDEIIGTFVDLSEGATYMVGGNTYRISYHGGSDNNDVVLTALNDAPLLTAAGPILMQITEDDIANDGQLVSSFRGAVTDPDGTTAFGIAITGVISADGTWQYRLDGSTSWVDFQAVDLSDCILLRDSDRVRFVPDGENGAVTGFSYRAWDRSAGSAGDRADATVSGGSTAFSAVEDTAILTVTSVNDAPALVTNATLTLAEGGLGTVATAQLSFADVDDGAGPAIYQVTALAQHGILRKSGNALAIGGTFTQQDIDSGAITYLHDDGESASDTFGFSVTDGTATVAGQVFTFNITRVDDAPVVANAVPDQVSAEDAPWSFTFAADTFFDVDGDTLTYTATLAGGAALPGWLQLDAGSRTFSGTPPANVSGMFEITVTATASSVQVADTFTLTITPVNDAPTQAANTGATLAEGASTTLTAGQLAFTDVDAGAVTTYTLTALPTNGRLFRDGVELGLSDTFTQQDIDTGLVSYTHDGSDTTTGSFGFSVSDGIATVVGQTFTFAVTPVNDAPQSQSAIAGGDEDTVIIGTLSADDAENQALTYSLVAQAAHGAVTVNPDGTFSYRPNADFNGTDQFTFRATDGSANSNVATVDVTVAAVNDAPVNAVPGTQVLSGQTSLAITGLSVADGDAAGGMLTTTLAVEHGTLDVGAGATVTGDGTDRVTLTGTLAAINTALAGVVYKADTGFVGTDTLLMTTDDGGNSGIGGALSDIGKVLIQVGQQSAGSPGGDGFTAVGGNSRIDGGSGVDTVTFDFKLTDATITWSGNEVIIDTANSHTVVTGVEIYAFRDGTVNNNDGDAMVDDLFYYARNHDVWNAHTDADQHFHSFGWREWRDPSAFFSTTFYAAVNQDVKGIDPLAHFHNIGWTQGRQPGPNFDAAAYLSANPDVAAGGADPLAHFLGSGAQEGRQPKALVTLATPTGFDYVYYLSANPDVAAAHVDPLQHFQTVGWKEGRDPNAYFDVKGYLASYADVRAGGMNPLDHYDQFGWREGRDPSADFDTTSYLDAYPDVAWGNSNPLVHFLKHGIQEGRQAFGDGIWG